MSPSDYRAHAEFIRAKAASGDVQTLHLLAFTLLNRLRDALLRALAAGGEG